MSQENTSSNKICLFGGTFDPIHKGHISMAKKVLELYAFDKIIFLPTGNSYLKTNVSDSSVRCEMVKLSIESDNSFEISYFEAQSDKPSYTYITLEHFKKLYPETDIYYLIGEDSLRYIENWKSSEIIFKLAHLLVAKRRNSKTNEDISIEDVKNSLEVKYGAKIDIFDFDMNISSTNIRNAVNNNHISEISDYLDENVLDYVINTNLYKTVRI